MFHSLFCSLPSLSLMASLFFLTSGPTKVAASSKVEEQPPPFAFHLLSRPTSLDPIHSRGASGAYLLNNIYSSLYLYDSKKGLVPEGASSCRFRSGLQVVCSLKRDQKFSDGTPVQAQHYIHSLRRIFKQKAASTELLLSLKNAKAVLKGKKPFKDLGVSSKGPYSLVFKFERPDFDFLYKLTSPAFTPSLSQAQYKNFKQIVNYGPYSIAQWKRNKIQLQPNRFYYKNKTAPPPVDIFVVDDHMAALRLFETKKMNFLRMLPTDQIQRFKKHSGFFQVPLARFDYMGFGPTLINRPKVRKALALSLRYPQLQKIYHALGTPGCPSLPRSFYRRLRCHKFSPSILKTLLKENLSFPKKIHFSRLGGRDILRGMEWVQFQWKKNLNGLSMDLTPHEQGSYMHQLSQGNMGVFRKGINLNRPTCLAALEIFISNSPDNTIGLKNRSYDKLVTQLRNTKKPSRQKNLCQKGIDFLMDNYHIIPMGEIHFSMLTDGRFVGWSVNSLNQLNLRSLRFKK